MKLYPALDIRTRESDLLLALLDDFSPTAIEERDAAVRAFFGSASSRDAALAALSSRFDATAIEVSDEDWARRSQEGLEPVTVGGITVVPNPLPSNPKSPSPNPDRIVIVIPPSTGFGTGHHATTRLCLEALQSIELTGKPVLDVGTGSGVLAIAADLLGASRATGIDTDPDAIQAARESLALNPAAHHVTFEIADALAADLPEADVVTANLTGALLARAARALWSAARPGGTLILSGLLEQERESVVEAFAAGLVVWERAEGGWVGLAVKKP